MSSNPPIEQSTFDAMVQENIEDLDMEPQEALEDAVTTLNAQNANLLYIIREIPSETENTHKVLHLTNLLKEGDRSILKSLSDELKSDELPKRYYACRNGALHSAICGIFEEEMKSDFESLDGNLIKCSVNCFSKQPDWASERLISLIVRALENVNDSEKLTDLLQKDYEFIMRIG